MAIDALLHQLAQTLNSLTDAPGTPPTRATA